MAIEKKADLTLKATEIRDETAPLANTANRIGVFGQTIIDTMLARFNVTVAELDALRTASAISITTYYAISNAVGSTRILEALGGTTNATWFFAKDLLTGEVGIYTLATDTFVAAANGKIVFILEADLKALETAGTLDTKTTYITTNSSPFKLICTVESANKLNKTATLLDGTYTGFVNYNVQTGAFTGGRISDSVGNIWNSCLPGDVTIGTGCVRNIFMQTALVTVGTNALNNTFGAKISGFVFGNNLQNVTVAPGTSGADYSSGSYSFLYNLAYPSMIFSSGGVVYHSYTDAANKRVVLTNLSTLVTTYIGSDTVIINCAALVLTTVADSSNYHFGILQAAPSSTDARRGFKFSDAGTVEEVSFSLEQVGNGSNETVTVYLRNITAGTEVAIGTFTSDFGASTTYKVLFSGLSLAVNTTSDYCIKITTPAFGTNPTSWIPSAMLSLTKS